MNRTLVLATGNDHKRRELAGILAGFEILVPGDLGVSFEFEETGTTYLENALGKGIALYRQLAGSVGVHTVIADDSGLSVVALDGAPGIHSARYGSTAEGLLLSAAEKNGLVLSRMSGTGDRRASFVCCMVLVAGPSRFGAVQETWDGEIAESPSSASGGFGYDPIFRLPELGLTVADLSEEEKNRLSHRARAARRILRLLKEESAD